MNNKIPTWLKEFMLKSKAGIGHLFIFWGNIYDLQKNLRGEYISLYQYLTEIFKQKDLVMFYSLSAGLQFANTEMEQLFRTRFLGAGGQGATGQSAAQSAAAGLAQHQAENAPIAHLVGGDSKDPMASSINILKFLEKVLTDSSKDSLKAVLIIDFAHNIVSGQSTHQNTYEKIAAEMLERWARDERIKTAGNTIMLLTPFLSNMPDGLRSSQGEVIAIRIPKPDEKELTQVWRYWIEIEKLTVDDQKDVTDSKLARLSKGLSFKQIEKICQLKRHQKQKIDLLEIKKLKQTAFKEEFGNRIQPVVPTHGFEYYGGMEKVKKYFRDFGKSMLEGEYSDVPMAVLLLGPPGTGKSWFLQCFASVFDLNYLNYPRVENMYLGESQRIQAQFFEMVLDLAPCIVFQDESDQAEQSREASNLDNTGVSNILRKQKFEFFGDESHRGKVILFQASNRKDLIDSAYLRKGRTDAIIYFPLPNLKESEEIFDIKFKHYNIPTNITDFSPFSEEVVRKVYCSGSDINWMVLEAKVIAKEEKASQVTSDHLRQALDEWELPAEPEDIDKQIILGIKGSSPKRLRPENWKNIVAEAEKRLYGNKNIVSSSSVFPGVADMKNVALKQ